MNENSLIETSIEQISAYSLLLSQALYEALEKKGLLSHREVADQIVRLQREMKLRRLGLESSDRNSDT